MNNIEKEGDLSILMSEGNQCNASFESMIKEEQPSDFEGINALIN